MNKNKPSALTRRDVIVRVLTAAGATAVIGSNTLLNAACATGPARSGRTNNTNFSAEQIRWLDEVAETILPATDTPGAKAAEVGAFIALMVTDTYDPQEQGRFVEGMRALEADCRKDHAVGFLLASPSQRLALLEQLDQQQHAQRTVAADAVPHYFRAIKELTLLGYFTSEIGYTQALRYVETPGRYEPCVDYQPGEKLWARHA